MEYTVNCQDGLYVVRGTIPIPDSECLGRFWRSSLADPVTDWQLAKALQASMVVGSRVACNACRHELGLPALKSPAHPSSQLACETDVPPYSMAR